MKKENRISALDRVARLIMLCLLVSVTCPRLLLAQQDKIRDLNGIWKMSDGGTIITIKHKGSSVYAMYLIEKSSALTNSSLENSDDALYGKFNGLVFTGEIHLLYTVKFSQKCHKEWSAVNEFTYDTDNHLFLMDFTRPYIELTLSKDGNKLQGSYKRPFDENNCIIKSPVLENIVFERVNISTQTIDGLDPFTLEVVQIHFVRKSDNGFDEIKEISYGEPFYVEAEFDSPPEEDKKTVTLDWGEGTGKKIIVKKQDDNPKIFLSDIIYVKRPDSPEENN